MVETTGNRMMAAESSFPSSSDSRACRDCPSSWLRTAQWSPAVASHFVHRAFVVMDRFHHPLDHRVEELASLLGIAVREQLHRSFKVGEQHGDLLALAFESRLGGEDLLGEMLWRVGIRRGEPGCSVSSGDGLPTLQAKLRAAR